MRRGIAAAIVFVCTATQSHSLTIEVDYRYDSNSFFSAAGNPDGAAGGAAARAALEAAAARWSAIIDQSLSPVALSDDADDVRIGFTHPGTGARFEVSSARSAATDALANSPADEYRGSWTLPADTWVLYAGGRPLGSAGIGGTGTGLNYTSVFNDPEGVHNRGFNVGFDSLPVWGGAISFSNSTTIDWHFDHTTPSGSGEVDFYSIALHEIGHALGLSASWDDWEANSSAGYFSGANAVAAYNADNGASSNRLLLQSGNEHWADGRYDSVIFPAGGPNYIGTVGAGALQDLLMEPIANFSYPTLRRFEATNVDVAALQDIGWSVISGAVGDPVISIDSVERSSDGAVTISWDSEAGSRYTVQTSLDSTTWSNVTPAVPSSGSSTSWTDGSSGYNDPNPPSRAAEKKFYRVVEN